MPCRDGGPSYYDTANETDKHAQDAVTLLCAVLKNFPDLPGKFNPQMKKRLLGWYREHAIEDAEREHYEATEAFEEMLGDLERIEELGAIIPKKLHKKLEFLNTEMLAKEKALKALQKGSKK